MREATSGSSSTTTATGDETTRRSELERPCAEASARLAELDEVAAADAGPGSVATLLRDRSATIDSFVAAARGAGAVDPALDAELDRLQQAALLFGSVADGLVGLADLDRTDPGLNVAYEAANQRFMRAASVINALVADGGVPCFDAIQVADAEEVPTTLEAACEMLEALGDHVASAANDDGTVGGFRRYVQALPEIFDDWIEVARTSRPDHGPEDAWAALVEEVEAAMAAAVATMLDGLQRYDDAEPIDRYFATAPDTARLDDVLQRFDDAAGFDCFVPSEDR